MVTVTNLNHKPLKTIHLPPSSEHKPFLRLFLEAFDIFCLLLDSLLNVTQLVLLLLQNQCWAKRIINIIPVNILDIIFFPPLSFSYSYRLFQLNISFNCFRINITLEISKLVEKMALHNINIS